jgi:hypothetical protein
MDSVSKKTIFLTHLYYPDSITESDYQCILGNTDSQNFINFCDQTKYPINSNCNKFISSPNKGKDIGGKLALIDLALKLKVKPDYYILLHDKKSPHTNLGDIWRSKLFRIIEPQYIEKIKHMFDQDSTLGIIAAKEFIINEYDSSTGNFSCTSNQILKDLAGGFKMLANI